MRNNHPKITVLMPAYNAGNYIASAIESVLTQTFSDFELLIINDGSTDNTQQIIETFKDDRIIVINQQNQGISRSLNTGLEQAKAKFIARFDADDICNDTRLEKQYDFLISHSEYIIVGTDAEYISESGEHLCYFHCSAHTHEQIMNDIFLYCPFTHSSVMYKKEVVLRCGGYPVDAHTFEDYLLWVKLSSYGKFYNLPEPLIKVRFSASSVTIDEKWRGKKFRQLKLDVIRKGAITIEEGNTFLHIISEQNTQRIKQGSYHALCSKKFLVNNHQPKQARFHIKKAISLYPMRFDNYILWALSYTPKKWIKWAYAKSRNFY